MLCPGELRYTDERDEHRTAAMESRTFVAVVLLGLLVAASCQQPPLPRYESVEAEPQADKQIGATLLGLITPALTNLLTMGTNNLFTALYNAIASFFSGRTLEMIPLDYLIDTPIRESATSTASNVHSYSPGGEPPKRRPYTRAMALGDEKPLQSSDPETTESS